MKRIMIAFLMIAMIVGAGFAQTGIIREFSGTVEVKMPGSQNFVPAQQGMTVTQDTIISTGLRSTAVIVVGSNILTLRPITRLSLAEIITQSETETLTVSLQTGRIRVQVDPPAGTRAATSVKTTTATASVRGTEWEQDTHNFYAHKGKVFVSGNKGLGTNISGGNSTVVTEGEVPVNQKDSYNKTLMPKLTVGSGESGETIVMDPPNTVDVDFGVTWGGGTALPEGTP